MEIVLVRYFTNFQVCVWIITLLKDIESLYGPSPSLFRSPRTTAACSHKVWKCACWTLICILCVARLSPGLWWSRRVGRRVDFWWIQWVWSHPDTPWNTGGSFPAGMFSLCVCVCVFMRAVTETHTHWWITAAIPGSNTSSGLRGLPAGLMFYQDCAPLPCDTLIQLCRPNTSLSFKLLHQLCARCF